MAEKDLATRNCFGGRGRLLLRKLTLKLFNERSRVIKNRERAWSEAKIKVENRAPASNYWTTGRMLQRSRNYHKLRQEAAIWIDIQEVLRPGLTVKVDTVPPTREAEK